MSSDFCGAQPRPHPAERAALARGKNGRRRSIALQAFRPPPVCQLSGSASKHGIPSAPFSFRLSLRSLISRTAGQTEAEVVVAVGRADVAVAVGDSAVVRKVGPAAAADATGGGPVQNIGAPLPHISAHIINPDFIGLFLSNWMRCPRGIILKPPRSIQIITPRISIFL